MHLLPNNSIIQSSGNLALEQFRLWCQEKDTALVTLRVCRISRGDGNALLLLVYRQQHASDKAGVN